VKYEMHDTKLQRNKPVGNFYQRWSMMNLWTLDAFTWRLWGESDTLPLRYYPIV
jgi:hypothetical protein